MRFPVVIFCSVSQRSRPPTGSKDNATFLCQDHTTDSRTRRPRRRRRRPTCQPPAHHDPTLHRPAPPPPTSRPFISWGDTSSGMVSAALTALSYASHHTCWDDGPPSGWWSCRHVRGQVGCFAFTCCRCIEWRKLHSSGLCDLAGEHGFQHNTRLTKRWCYVRKLQHCCKGMLESFLHLLKQFTETNVNNSGGWTTTTCQCLNNLSSDVFVRLHPSLMMSKC